MRCARGACLANPTYLHGAMITLERLFISPGHNYFGHHGKPAGENPVLEVSEIECVSGRGIRGDRFFDFAPDYKGQITFFSAEVFQEMVTKLSLSRVDAAETRRNVLVSGVCLNSLVGQEFEIQGVRFQGMQECRPCYWMDKAFTPGAEDFMKGQGGLRAKILTDGVLRVSEKHLAFTGGLLAGGQSKRMGRDKAGVQFHGMPLWQHQIQTLSQLGAHEILISGRPNASYANAGFPLLSDAAGHMGPLAGVHALLSASAHPLTVILAVDMPLMTPEYLRYLLSQCTPTTGVVVDNGGFLEGLAAVYPKAALPTALVVLNSDTPSMQSFARLCESRGLLKILPSTPDEATLFRSVNYAADLVEALLWTPHH